jgi:CheY-like chemotaxis protein
MTSRHLLLVDDDSQMAVLVGILARRAGLPLLCRQDVDSAWSAIRDDCPELVLLDINLPGQRGVELLHRRRGRSGGVSFRVALFCQSIQTRDIAEGWQAGADYLLAKDLVTRPADWLCRVCEILEHAHGQRLIPSLGWPEEDKGRLYPRWAEHLNRALLHSCLWPLGPELIDQILWRALMHAFGTEARPSWLVARAGRLDPDAVPTATSEEFLGCFDSLVDQVWCLLGFDPSEQFSVALRSIVVDPP